MRELYRMIKGEFFKMRHTFLPWMHLLIPALGIVVFLMYYSFAMWSNEGKVQGYIQVLSIALPLVISVICSLSVEMERSGHFQTFLGTAIQKRRALLAKWMVLSGLGLAALLLAVMGFAAGFWAMTGKMVLSKEKYLLLTIVLWAGSMNLYLLHLFMNLAFSKLLSVCMGTAEFLTASLFLTGLGEGRWQFFPCSWGSRWCGYLLLYWKGTYEKALGSAVKSLGVNAVITAALWCMILLWFHFYEGGENND